MSVTSLATIDLAASWAKVYAGLTKAAGSSAIFTLFGAVGAIIVVAAIGKWAWDRRRGSGGGGAGGGSNALLGALVIGMALSAPDVMIPLVLGIADWVANAIIGVAGG